ncbi:hypothetical protein K461DRAFT_270794 [Myriangium duriaei CBS 260.36]|uniref:Uncharacterized protein n=1 Tax=Myriangium duriaei CBS 260.36 TaxID=1168546 RepID=A0A9P4MES5_9PEZI|nr:hypothetical protein K461DRAFT_270794 [Myriangium duriaei CBS 260.36]
MSNHLWRLGGGNERYVAAGVTCFGVTYHYYTYAGWAYSSTLRVTDSVTIATSTVSTTLTITSVVTVFGYINMTTTTGTATVSNTVVFTTVSTICDSTVAASFATLATVTATAATTGLLTPRAQATTTTGLGSARYVCGATERSVSNGRLNAKVRREYQKILLS